MTDINPKRLPIGIIAVNEFECQLGVENGC